MAKVAMVIATVCSPERASSLRRAVESILSQEGVDVELTLSANGPRVDADLLSELVCMSPKRIQTVRIAAGDFTAALAVGRGRANGAEFVGFLDDDDALYPSELTRRVECLRRYKHSGVVSTGELEGDDGRRFFPACGLPEEPAYGERGLLGLLRAPYMISGCAALFQESAVTAEMLAGRPRQLEWTSLAFDVLSAGGSIGFLHEPGYLKGDTPGSMSKDRDVVFLRRRGLEALLSRTIYPKVRRELKRKIAAECHSESEFARVEGRFPEARRAHLASLRRGGWRYIFYTRRLLSKRVWQT